MFPLCLIFMVQFIGDSLCHVNICLKTEKRESHAITKSLIILIVGFVLLIKGADFFVEGTSAVAKRLRIPSMIIGMTIVAMGTSLPNAVSVTAS